VRENLLEYNPYNIEVWTEKEIGKGGMNDCTFKDNFLRFAGYGWGTLARLGSTTKMVGNISFYDYTIPCKNVIISGNIFTAFVHANFAATETAYQAVSGLAIGGTSVIIVVGVALETVKALEAQMLMRHYKGFLD
jgi:hypothetical protein